MLDCFHSIDCKIEYRILSVTHTTHKKHCFNAHPRRRGRGHLTAPSADLRRALRLIRYAPKTDKPKTVGKLCRKGMNYAI